MKTTNKFFLYARFTATLIAILSMGAVGTGCNGSFRDHSTREPVFGPDGQVGIREHKDVHYDGPVPWAVPVQTCSWSYPNGYYPNGYNWFGTPQATFQISGSGGVYYQGRGNVQENFRAAGLKGPPP